MRFARNRDRGLRALAQGRCKCDCPSDKASTADGAGRILARLTIWLKTAGSLIVLIWLLATICMLLTPRTLVEPVAVPKNLAERGVTDQVVQQRLAAALNQVLIDADS